jgi:hypothetical protein
MEITPARSLLEVARENAAEGCVRETFGALVATWQARTAADPLVRATMAGIAVDESRHAALSWAIDGWARSRLGAAGGRELDEARAEARMELRATAGAPVDPALVREAGLPSAVMLPTLMAKLHSLPERAS